jgi:hypothetical protein
MRVFQNYGIYYAYRPRLARLAKGQRSFQGYRSAFMADRYGASHYLLPVERGDPDAFFTLGDVEAMQVLWAKERGMASTRDLGDILRAQIEHHRTEVFYNMDPMRYGNDFTRRLPGCVKHVLTWRAAPSGGKDFSNCGMLVCNFPGILRDYAAAGWRHGYLAPSHDPEMDSYAANEERPIDVLFVGGYSRHHRRRAEVLEAVASLKDRHRVVFHLDRSRMTRLAESPVGRLLPLSRHRRPDVIAKVTAEPVFGRDLYTALSQAKIVLNGAVDMAGEDRGNMRCFEAMGCGCVMVSDAGRYPAGMVDGATMRTYDAATQAPGMIEHVLDHASERRSFRESALQVMRTTYSKVAQWQTFQQLVASMS